MKETKIYNENFCAACYFRTVAEYPQKKCLLQLTEKCNLHCEHCFVSANCSGEEMQYNDIKDIIIPQLLNNNVTKVTLTGGEPFMYKRLLDVVDLLISNNISVCICTNATLITEDFLNHFLNCNNLHFNVSLDGFSPISHGKFRGNENPEIYNNIIRNIKILGENSLNIWFLHSIIFANAWVGDIFQKIAFLPKKPILVVIWVFAILLPISIFINWVFKKQEIVTEKIKNKYVKKKSV